LTAATAAEERAVRRSSRADVLVPLLACLVEGSAIAVVDALFAAGGGRQPLGPFVYALFAGIGLVWVRRASPDAERPGLLAIAPVVFVASAGLAAGVGALSEGFPIELVGQPAAWLGVVALVRGTAHRDAEEEDVVVADLLRFGIPLLTIPWLLSVALPAATRPTFIAAAFPATVLFAGAGLLALGLARLEALAIASGVDWRRNRAWLLLLGGVVLLVLAVAIPAALLVGEPLERILGGLAGPFAALFTPIFGLLGLLLMPIIGFLTDLIGGLLRPLQEALPSEPAGMPVPYDPTVVDPTQQSDLGPIIATLITLVVVVVGLIVLVALARRRIRPQGRMATPDEEHEFVPPTLSVHLPRWRRPARTGPPITATGAYLAFLTEAERAGGSMARRPTEGPETHARRVAADGLARAPLLAADYELERYAGRDLPPRETRRALGRWQRLRESLRSRSQRR
jgi:hypothetical protein